MEVDLPPLPGVLGLEIVRHYNSQYARPNVPPGIFGRGWRLSYETELYELKNTVQIVQADGTRIIFSRDPKNPSLCATADPARGQVVVRTTPRGEEFVWVWPEGRRLFFDARGKLTQIVAPTGEFVTLTRDAAGALLKVTDPQGRSLLLSYADRRDPERFHGVRFVDSPAGRFAYAYGSSLPAGADPAAAMKVKANLVSVALPSRYRPEAAAHPFADRGTTQSAVTRSYHHESARHPTLLTGISVSGTGSDGVTMQARVASWDYDDDARAVLSVKGERPADGTAGPEEIRLMFPRPGTTVLTNSLGQTTTYRWGEIAGELRLLEALGPGCASCGPTNVRYGYDAAARLTVSTRLDARGKPRVAERLIRDAAGRVAREERVRFVKGKPVPHGWVRYEYATVPAASASADPDALILPDPKPRRVIRPSVVAGRTHEWRVTYNAAGQPLSVTESGFAPALPEVGQRGEPAPIARTTTYAYATINGRSLLATIDGPLPNGPKADPSDSDVTRFEWDARGDFVSSLTTPGKMTTSFTRDEAGRVMEQAIDDGWRRVAKTVAYSPLGVMERLTLTATPSASADHASRASLDGSNLSRIERAPILFRYDALGQLSQVVGSDGTSWRQTYDTQTRTRTLTTAEGEILQRFDREGQLLAWLLRDPQGAIVSGQLNLWNAAGQLTARFNPLGEITANAHTTNPAPLHGVLDGTGGATWMAVLDDGQRRLLSPDGSERWLLAGRSGTAVHDAAGRAHVLWRDDFGRPVRELAPDEGVLDYTYTENGVVKRQRGTHGETLAETLRFDMRGRPVERIRGDCVERLAYAGAVLARIEGCGNVQAFARDAFGQIVRHTQSVGTSQDTRQLEFATQYAYRPSDGRLQARTLPDGQRLHYHYVETTGRVERIARERSWLNAARRLSSSLADRLDAALPTSLTEDGLLSDLAYRPFGPETRYTQANGAVTETRLDVAGRITEVSVAHEDKPLLGLSYSWSGAERISTVTHDTERRVFEHDALGRLTGERDEAGSALFRAAYSPLGERRETPPVRDGFGRQAERHGMTLVYDAAHRLSALRRNYETVATYSYDALGNRMSKTVAGRTTLFLYDLQHRLVAEAEADGTVVAQYLYAGHRPYAALRSSGGRQTRDVFAVHADPRGLPLAVSDARGHVVWRGDFDAFGNKRAPQAPETSAQFAMPLRLAGQYFDEESGLHYNVHRYYDPQRGEYLTPDPLGLVDADNAYAYARSNPLAEVDPLGLFKIPGLAFSSPPALISGIVLDVQDGGHGDILRIAFAQYNRENGLRFSQTIIDQIIRNNYWTDAAAGGQFNHCNHWDNPNDGPMYASEGGGKTASYTDGSGDNWLQEALNLINTNRGYYQSATAISYAPAPKPGPIQGVDISTILASFGQNSHILADFYAHTNWVDSDCRGGKVENKVLLGANETGWVPVGFNQTSVWNETVSDKLFSGTAASLPSSFCPLGDVVCAGDETTHGFWNKDSDKTPGGKEKYTGPVSYGWDVQSYNPNAPQGGEGNPDPALFGTTWYADYGITQAMVKPGTRIYVQRKVSFKFDLAFQLAIDHTRQEIAKLYDGAVGLTVNGQQLTDIFKMDKAQLFQNNVTFTTPSLRQ